MRKLILLASAAAMAVITPALAEAKGQGKGQSARSGETAQMGRSARARTEVRSRGNARTDARANARARNRTGASVDRRLDTDGDGIPDYRDRNMGTAIDRTLDRDGDGIPDYRDRRVDFDRDGIDDRRGSRRGGVSACPPGLANRTPACVPPGQARRMWNQGQTIPTSWRDYVSYQDLLGRLPEQWRDDVPMGDYRYIYRDNTVYVVDPRTRLINRIIDIVF